MSSRTVDLASDLENVRSRFSAAQPKLEVAHAAATAQQPAEAAPSEATGIPLVHPHLVVAPPLNGHGGHQRKPVSQLPPLNVSKPTKAPVPTKALVPKLNLQPPKAPVPKLSVKPLKEPTAVRSSAACATAIGHLVAGCTGL